MEIERVSEVTGNGITIHVGDTIRLSPKSEFMDCVVYRIEKITTGDNVCHLVRLARPHVYVSEYGTVYNTFEDFAVYLSSIDPSEVINNTGSRILR